MILLRVYLFGGLILHKLIWEGFKRGGRAARPAPRALPLKVRIVKLVKVAILVLIAIQTLVPGFVLPLAAEPATLIALGTAIYTIGLVVAIVGRVQLGGNWSDIETAQVLPRQAVVDTGIYRYVRHPIYVGDLLLLLGLELALNSWLVLGVVALTPAVLLRAIREEDLLRASLPGYVEYCATSKRFIPFVV